VTVGVGEPPAPSELDEYSTMVLVLSFTTQRLPAPSNATSLTLMLRPLVTGKLNATEGATELVAWSCAAVYAMAVLIVFDPTVIPPTTHSAPLPGRVA
jgi:hypothetical protein